MSLILYGICGIGYGHVYRQLPILDELKKQKHKVMIFTYGASYEFLFKKFSNNSCFHIVEVWNPYFKGGKDGIDFKSTFELNAQDSVNFKKNIEAFKKAQQWLGRPDLVLSDYEQISAQYAYAQNAPLITIDQQSKFMVANLPKINNYTYNDEISRLNMFFPKATQRISCSFFKIKTQDSKKMHQIVPSIIRNEIVNIKNVPQKNVYIVYQTNQLGCKQSLEEWIDLFTKRDELFYIFTNKNQVVYTEKYKKNSNIHFYLQGDKKFEEILSVASGIISTAGHSLLSEAMYLKIPVLALPLDLYEQQLSAKIIGDNQFGLNCSVLNFDILDKFVKDIKKFRKNIIKDKNILYKKNGKKQILNFIQSFL